MLGRKKKDGDIGVDLENIDVTPLEYIDLDNLNLDALPEPAPGSYKEITDEELAALEKRSKKQKQESESSYHLLKEFKGSKEPVELQDIQLDANKPTDNKVIDIDVSKNTNSKKNLIIWNSREWIRSDVVLSSSSKDKTEICMIQYKGHTYVPVPQQTNKTTCKTIVSWGASQVPYVFFGSCFGAGANIIMPAILGNVVKHPPAKWVIDNAMMPFFHLFPQNFRDFVTQPYFTHIFLFSLFPPMNKALMENLNKPGEPEVKQDEPTYEKHTVGKCEWVFKGALGYTVCGIIYCGARATMAVVDFIPHLPKVLASAGSVAQFYQMTIAAIPSDPYVFPSLIPGGNETVMPHQHDTLLDGIPISLTLLLMNMVPDMLKPMMQGISFGSDDPVIVMNPNIQALSPIPLTVAACFMNWIYENTVTRLCDYSGLSKQAARVRNALTDNSVTTRFNGLFASCKNVLLCRQEKTDPEDSLKTRRTKNRG